MTTTRTYRQHVTAKHNFRQQRVVPLSDETAAKLVAWRAGRVELTPPTKTSVQWGEKGRGEDGRVETIHNRNQVPTDAVN